MDAIVKATIMKTAIIFFDPIMSALLGFVLLTPNVVATDPDVVATDPDVVVTDEDVVAAVTALQDENSKSTPRVVPPYEIVNAV